MADGQFGLGLTRTQLFAYIDSLGEEDKADLFAIMRELDERTFYQYNPAQWMEDVLGIKLHTIKWSLNPGYQEQGFIDENGEYNEGKWDGTPDPIIALLNGLAHWNDVAVESATGTGKTFIAAAIVLWFLAVFPGAKVITTAPKKDLIERNLWGEIGKLFPKFQKKYPKAEITHLMIRMAPDDRAHRDTWVGFGFVASVGAGEESAAKAQGFHGEHMLFILDEAVGIDEAVMEAVENTCTGPHNLRLLLGNPSSVTDTLHKFATQAGVTHVKISAYDHPNVVGNPEPTSVETYFIEVKDHVQVIPGAVSWKSVYSRRAKYGPEPSYYNNHPLYKSRVRGICPSGSAHSLFTNKVLDVVQQYMGAHGENPIDTVEHSNYQGAPMEGTTKIFAEPKHTHIDRYLIFGDVAEDALSGDAHAAIVFDRVTQAPAAIVHLRGPRSFYAKELVRLGEMYKTYQWQEDRWHYPVICWERNAPGALHLVPEFMAYPNLYLQRHADKPKQGKAQNTYGWFTSGKSRPDMVRALEDWGLTLREHPWRVRAFSIFKEMQTFEYSEKKKRYQHRDGHHDDLMMAMGGVLALSAILPDPIPIPEEPPKETKHLHEQLLRLKLQVQARIKGRGTGEYGSAYDKADVRKSAFA